MTILFPDQQQRFFTAEIMSERFTQGLKILAALVALAFIPLFLYIACSRVGYPFDLEWLEGAAASNTLRAMNGLPIYVKPTLDYVPEVYTPLYFYLSAVPSLFMGIGFAPLRLVSIIFTIWSMILLYAIGRRETGQVSHGLLAAGIFAATFGVTGAWFDLARVDSMFLFLLLLGFCLVRYGRTSASSVAAGVVAALAFFTKQTALGLFIPLLVWAVFAWRRRSIWFAGISLTLIGGGFLLLDFIHEGWFSYYTVTLPAMDVIREEMLLRFWWADLLLVLPVATVAVVVYFVLTVSGQAHRPSRDAWFFFLAGGGMVGLSWLARIHKGGYLNVLMPAYAFLALMLPLGFHAVEHALKYRRPLVRHGVMTLIYLLLILQLVSLAVVSENSFLPVARWIPTEEDRAAGEAMVKLIENFEGPVFTPFHCFLPVRAGKRYCGSRGAMMPILYGGDDQRKMTFIEESILGFRRHKYDAIILDKKRFRHIQEAIDLYYREEPGLLIGREDLFRTVSGMRTQPQYLYLPRPQ